MAYAVALKVVIEGDRMMFDRTSKRLRDPRDLMDRLGVLGLKHGVERLVSSYRNDALVGPSGHLAASLTPGGAANVFKLDPLSVEVGTNVPYAAQRHFGGRIKPTEGKKALSIPLQPSLQRHGIWPSELDPAREDLRFVPMIGGASGNVFGLLIDDENLFGFGEDTPLYALARYVDQPATPYLDWEWESARRDIDDLVLDWMN